MTSNQIVILHGTHYQEMAVELCTKIDLASDIGARTTRIGIKPNLVLDASADSGATTHPELVAGVLDYLHACGFTNICVLEGAWVGASTAAAYRASGIGQVCQVRGVPYYDLQKDSSTTVDAHGIPIKVCDRIQEIDYLINMPVMKGHCQTRVTCALKNAKGLIPNSEKRRFHTLGLHRPIAHLNTVVPEGLVLVDNICGDLDFEEGGNPVAMDRIFCCKDPVLCDAYVCECLGYQVDDVPYIRMAEQLGVGCADTGSAEIISLNQGTGQSKQKMTRRIQALAAYVAPKDACSACYGALLYALDRLDASGGLRGKKEKISIGQGYKDQPGILGVGTCTRHFACNLAGCPPKTDEIIRFLEENWK